MFSRYCEQAFTVEMCQVETIKGQKCTYPELAYQQRQVEAKKINGRVGINESPADIATLLTRMCLSANADGDLITVRLTFYLPFIIKC